MGELVAAWPYTWNGHAEQMNLCKGHASRDCNGDRIKTGWMKSGGVSSQFEPHWNHRPCSLKD